MNNLLYIILIFSLSIILNYSQADTGPASKYVITITKIELCTGYPDSGEYDVTCNGSVTVGEGSLTLDIASVDPGTEIATFSNTNGLPIGTTYTHAKLTLTKDLIIKGYAQDDTDCWCRTESDSTFNSEYGRFGSLQAGICEADEATALANAEDQTMYSTYSGTVVYCKTPACTSSSNTGNISHSIEQDGLDQSLYGLALDNGSSSSATSMFIIYKLSSPYKVGITAPKINISFGTQSAVSSNEWDENNDKCLIYPYYPRADINITD